MYAYHKNSVHMNKPVENTTHQYQSVSFSLYFSIVIVSGNVGFL